MEDRHLFLLNVVRKRVNMCVAGGWIAWLIKAKSWFPGESLTGGVTKGGEMTCDILLLLLLVFVSFR